jgi:TatD DNase family protein
MLVDSHCHLDRLDLKPYDGQLGLAIEAAIGRGVERMLCISISTENRETVLDIARKYDNIYASTGIHPLDVQTGTADAQSLVQWGSDPDVVALGESGLDYYYDEATKALQQESFIAHLEAGKEAQLPVVVHTRSAKEDTLRLIKEHGCEESAGVLHCFTEDWDMARQAMDMNYMISISGIVTFKNADQLRDVAKRVPSDRLLVETDSPYLAPVPYRGKKNEPKYVREVAEYVAQLRGVSVEQLAEQTTANFDRLFLKR